jgi:hypothetical protein
MTAYLPFESFPGRPVIVVSLPIRTTNPLNASRIGNSRLAAIIKTQERARQRQTTKLLVQAAMQRIGVSRAQMVPAVVTLTRVSAGRLDGDGLQASFKAIRDGVADSLGVNDGGPFVEWRYLQEKGPQKHHEIKVWIERVAP